MAKLVVNPPNGSIFVVAGTGTRVVEVGVAPAASVSVPRTIGPWRLASERGIKKKKQMNILIFIYCSCVDIYIYAAAARRTPRVLLYPGADRVVLSLVRMRGASSVRSATNKTQLHVCTALVTYAHAGSLEWDGIGIVAIFIFDAAVSRGGVGSLCVRARGR